MKRLITLGIGAALGYLLGSREGRKNLDKFAKNAQSFWNDPKTQDQVQKATQKATTTVKDQAPVMADKAAGSNSIHKVAVPVANKAAVPIQVLVPKPSNRGTHLLTFCRAGILT